MLLSTLCSSETGYGNGKGTGKKRHCSQPLEGASKKVVESGSESGEVNDDNDSSDENGEGSWSVVEKGKRKMGIRGTDIVKILNI